MKIDATIQARLGSSRLPGKVLAPILGKPLIEYQIERIRRSKIINRVVISTTTNPLDDAIVELAQRLGCECFRGSEDDVVGRVLGSLNQFEIEVNAEFQGDNSIPDPQIIDQVLSYYVDHCEEFDYVTNSLKTTYPPGLEVSVYPRSVLEDAEARIVEPLMREHVGIHIYQHPERYRVKNLEAPPEFRRPNLHLEVDTAEDLELVSAIYRHFMPTNPEFLLADVIAFTDANPDLTRRTENLERRWRRYRNDH